MKPDRQGLQSWYRDAMLKRIDELVGLREAVAKGSSSASDELRSIGQALRGSGGTFGFPELSVAAGKVETTPDEQAARRLEGLLVELRLLVGEKRDEAARVFEWLAVCAGLDPEAGVTNGLVLADAWTVASEQSGLDESELVDAIADRFHLELAALSRPNRAAQRLVPEAFMSAQRVVPLAEDSTTIRVATADPVSLRTELELERLTGRRPIFALASPRALEAVLAASAGGTASAEVPRDEVEAVPVGAGLAQAAPGDTAAGAGGQMEAGPAEVVSAGREPGDGQPMGVLVVDDEPSARLLVRALLEKRGFDTVEACDGIEALEVIRRHDHIGLAVVDLNMPRMDGLELIWELRDARAWANLPVIVVTGEKDEILETQIMEEGADDYIRKPVDPRLFLARVDATLRRAGHAMPG